MHMKSVGEKEQNYMTRKVFGKFAWETGLRIIALNPQLTSVPCRILNWGSKWPPAQKTEGQNGKAEGHNYIQNKINHVQV